MITLSQSRHRARKPHRCCECLGVIAAGDFYERARIVDGGDAWTWKGHLLCLSASNVVARELDLCYGDEGPDPDQVRLAVGRFFGNLSRLVVAA